MRTPSQSHLPQGEQFIVSKSISRLLIVSFLFIAAFGIRLYHLNEPPLDFHADRQYHGALMARHYYFESIQSMPEWRKEIARINNEGILEPPIMEFLAFLAYRLVGEEKLWIPRLFSVLFWLIGGVFLYLLAKELISDDAALCATAFYLLLPYGVSASRSFQPDPLMIMMLLASLLAILRNHLQPSRARLAIAAAVSALAILIKPMSLFVIFGAFVSLAVFEQGILRTVMGSNSLTFTVVSLVPGICFYTYGMFMPNEASRININMSVSTSFLPHLLGNPVFWKSWLNFIDVVIGQTAFLVALLGVLMFRDGLSKALLLGLWIGYMIFGLVFNYHIHIASYYHLQLIPIVALSLGPIGALILNGLRSSCTRWYWQLAVGGVLVMALLLSVQQAKWRLDREFKSQVSVAQEIGDVVHHSTKIVFLADNYGLPLKYHGEVSGEVWPNHADLRLDKLRGRATMSVEERLNSMISKYSTDEYFVITDLKEFEAQQDLKQFLVREFPLVAESSNYLIFDLTGGHAR